MAVYIGLVHYPIYNRNMEVVTTSLTNYDLHDIARTARTYGMVKYFIIQPNEAQAKLAQDVIDYWQTGYGSEYHKDRKEAFSILQQVATIEEAIQQIQEREGQRPFVVTTDARTYPNTISYQLLRDKLTADDQPYLLLFGTGWGIEKKTMAKFDFILAPIYGAVDYNHLPVRAAAAIILDRLLGEIWWK
jgi:hypothetical protein